MTSAYFNTLNYTLANEDTQLELRVLPEGLNHVVSVAGSGARVLPLFAKNPKALTCVDLSREQLWLTELRIETARVLSHQEFLQFWGYPPFWEGEQLRRRVLAEIRISVECREFFNGLFSALNWQSVLYCGRWERTFQKISGLCQLLLRGDAERIFEAVQSSEHDRFMKQEFSRIRWNFLIFLIGNSTFFNALLYRGHFPQKNIPLSHQEFYKRAFDRIFFQGPARENFFLQLTLLGTLKFPEGNPVECQPEVYRQIQTGIRQSKVIYRQSNIVEAVEGLANSPADFVSLSDVPSYFDQTTGEGFLQRMNCGLAPRALVVSRYYLRVIDWVNRQGFATVTEEFRSAVDSEKTQMYLVDVFRKQAV